MRVGRKLKPGQPGTKRLLARYGRRLVCVRYRYDEQRKLRYTTVELIVATAEWVPKGASEAEVAVQVDFQEYTLWGSLKMEGGRWDPKRRVFWVPYRIAALLGLTDRIVREPGVQYWTACRELDLKGLSNIGKDSYNCK